jgi:hypothetical protein
MTGVGQTSQTTPVSTSCWEVTCLSPTSLHPPASDVPVCSTPSGVTALTGSTPRSPAVVQARCLRVDGCSVWQPAVLHEPSSLLTCAAALSPAPRCMLAPLRSSLTYRGKLQSSMNLTNCISCAGCVTAPAPMSQLSNSRDAHWTREQPRNFEEELKIRNRFHTWPHGRLQSLHVRRLCHKCCNRRAYGAV